MAALGEGVQGPVARKRVRRFFAGGIAGVAAKTASAPLERAKIMLQAGTAAGNGAAAGAQPPGVLRLMADIVRAEGVAGLWAGNMANAMRVLPSKGILFMTNDLYKDALGDALGVPPAPTAAAVAAAAAAPAGSGGGNGGGGGGGVGGVGTGGAAGGAGAARQLPPLVSVAAGSLAGVSACLCTYPLDLARARAAGHFNSRYVGMRGALLTTLREDGVIGLYRGIGPTIAGAVPFEGLKFGIFDALTRRLPAAAYDSASGKPSALWCGALGGVSGMAAGFLLFPNDTVRRRCQLDGGDGKPRQYRGALDCWRMLFRTQGLRGFYHGFGADMLRRVPSAAIQFAVYGALK